MTLATLDRATDNAQVVAKIVTPGFPDRDVTRGELTEAFNAVADKANWKNPIDKTLCLDDFAKALVCEAVIFFAGCVPTFERIGGTTTGGIGRYRVKAVGYYAAVGA